MQLRKCHVSKEQLGRLVNILFSTPFQFIFILITSFFLCYFQTEQDKIRELSQQLATEKKRSAAYKRHLELIFEQIEEQNENLSKKIQHIVDSVKEMEAKEEHSRQWEGDGSQRRTY